LNKLGHISSSMPGIDERRLAPKSLFVSESSHRIDAHSASRRNVTREHANHQERGPGCRKCERILRLNAHQPRTQETRCGQCHNSSRGAAGSNDDEPLANEQRDDLCWLSANGKTNADFASPPAHFVGNDPKNPQGAQQQG